MEASMPTLFQLQQLPSRKKPAPKRALLFLVLLIVILCSGLAGCSAEAASEQPLTKAEIAAQATCPKGHAVLWVDSTTTECRKEMP